MGASLRLPNELRQFLDLPGPQSLLLRGPPGSGKSTMGLAILEAFAGRKVLVTTRVSRDELLRAFPWLNSPTVEPAHLIDASDHPGHAVDAARVAERVSALVKPGTKDSRDLAEFLWLPPALQEAWSRLEEGGRSIVVVDSWDALIEDYLGRSVSKETPLPDRAEIERLLLQRMQATAAHVVLVLERREETQLDYLVNGTVVTDREIRGERLERWIMLPKLRGVRIANGAYPFTLEGARFQCIEPIRSYDSVSVGHVAPEPDHLPGFLWPGSTDFAECIGRLPAGHISLVERGEGVLWFVASTISDPIVAHTLARGGRVLMVPVAGRSLNDIWEAMRNSVPKHKFLEQIRVVDADGNLRGSRPSGKHELSSVVLPVEPPPKDTPPPDLESSPAIKFLRESATPQAPGLLVLNASGLDAMMSRLGVTLQPSMMGTYSAMFQQVVYRHPVHALVIGPSTSPLVSGLREVASLHLFIEARQGRAILHGIHPWTPSLLMTEGSAEEPYGLLRVV